MVAMWQWPISVIRPHHEIERRDDGIGLQGGKVGERYVWSQEEGELYPSHQNNPISSVIIYKP